MLVQAQQKHCKRPPTFEILQSVLEQGIAGLRRLVLTHHQSTHLLHL